MALTTACRGPTINPPPRSHRRHLLRGEAEFTRDTWGFDSHPRHGRPEAAHRSEPRADPQSVIRF